jgi:hypothetical protein
LTQLPVAVIHSSCRAWPTKVISSPVATGLNPQDAKAILGIPVGDVLDERRGRPLPQLEQGVGDAWILIAFIVVLGLIFVVAAWVGRF